MLDMLSSLGEQILPVTVNGPCGTDGLLWPIRSPQQADTVQILQPLTIAHVTFATRYIFDMPGVD